MALIKWVTCRVTDRAGFDRGQRGWAELAGHPGFGGQWGGWDGPDAHIVAAWADEETYRAFMGGVHDRIAAAQAGTYGSVSVRVFAHRRDIGAGLGSLSGAAVLRLAHGSVRPTGVTAAPGMTGGAVAESGDGEFLVLTGWRSGRRPAAAAAGTGVAVDLVPAWTVPGLH